MRTSIKTETQYAKANYYHSDGTGRDTYIGNDNGGLTQQIQRTYYGPSGAFRPKRQPNVYRPQSSSKVLHYTSDGTGRDNYVLDNHGGLLNTQSSGHWLSNFKRQLRTPDRVRPSSGFRGNYKHQFEVVRRLSQPKYINTPFHLQKIVHDL